MKQILDKYTVDLFEKPRRVRPPVAHTKTPAQRLRAYRQRQKFNFLNFVQRDEKSA